MSFRPATIEDAPLLYRWRREAETGSWYGNNPTSFHQHQHWLKQRLDNELVELLMWEQDGEPVGMVRIDSNGEVAFHGDDPAMLEAIRPYARFYGGRLKAAVDHGDPNGKMFLDAGFREYECLYLEYQT